MGDTGASAQDVCLVEPPPIPPPPSSFTPAARGPVDLAPCGRAYRDSSGGRGKDSSLPIIYDPPETSPPPKIPKESAGKLGIRAVFDPSAGVLQVLEPSYPRT